MKKQVILTGKEYQELIKCVALGSKLVDKYIRTENPKLDDVGHILDSDECDEDVKEFYSILLYMDSLHSDIEKELGEEYIEEHPESALFAETEDLF